MLNLAEIKTLNFDLRVGQFSVYIYIPLFERFLIIPAYSSLSQIKLTWTFADILS